ncbi:MAG: response regulator [Treponema sp.]|nr:response regulator [Treponema sp.]
MKSVLVVDDSLPSLRQICSQLGDHYEVSLAKSGEQALQICATERPNLILLDVEMPDMDGFQTIAGLKQDPALSHIPVVFLTGSHEAATEVRCLEMGAADFIAKPANPEILRHRIDLHLQLSAYQLHLEHMIKELEDNISTTYAELLECKEFNIAGHLMRTSAYVELITRELLRRGTFGDALTKENADMMKRAAPFHDIGKIGVSDIILLKPSSLTKEEYAKLQQHTQIGGRMLRAIYERTPNQLYLKTAIEIAEGHHECFDGTGYPAGLAGNDIPLSCRIMSLANVYDSLITDRVYRNGYPHEEAVRIILTELCTRFDPGILDTFNALKDRFLAVGTSPHFQAQGLGRNIYHEARIDS